MFEAAFIADAQSEPIATVSTTAHVTRRAGSGLCAEPKAQIAPEMMPDQRRQQREGTGEAEVALHARPIRRATIAPTNVFSALANSWSSEKPLRRPKSFTTLSESAPTNPPRAATTDERGRDEAEAPSRGGHERGAGEARRRARPRDRARRSRRQRAKAERRERAPAVERADLRAERVGQRRAEGRDERDRGQAEQQERRRHEAVRDDVGGAAPSLVAPAPTPAAALRR